MIDASTVQVVTYREGSTTRLLIDGDLDEPGASTVCTYVQAELYRGVELVLDVEGVEFIDAAAIRLLLDAHDAVRRRRAELRIGNAHGAVLRMIELAGAGAVLDDRHQRAFSN